MWHRAPGWRPPLRFWVRLTTDQFRQFTVMCMAAMISMSCAERTKARPVFSVQPAPLQHSQHRNCRMLWGWWGSFKPSLPESIRSKIPFPGDPIFQLPGTGLRHFSRWPNRDSLPGSVCHRILQSPGLRGRRFATIIGNALRCHGSTWRSRSGGSDLSTQSA